MITIKSIEELRGLYDADLVSEFESLEKERLNVHTKMQYFTITCIGIGVLIFIAPLILSISFRLNPSSSNEWSPWNFVQPLLMLHIIISIFVHKKITSSFFQKYQDKLIKLMLSYKNGTIEYSKESNVSADLFRESGLFLDNCTSYACKNLFSGEIGTTNFAFTDYLLEYPPRSPFCDNTYIIEGTIYVADFNKNFNGSTYVLPEKNDTLTVQFAIMNQSAVELVKLENPEFEKLFVVHGSDQIEARCILTLTMMEKLVQLKNELDMDIMVSFRNSKIFVVVPYFTDITKPQLNQTMCNFGQIGFLQSLIDIVEELNLNRQIRTL